MIISNKKLTLVRNEVKDHGTQKIIEGHTPTNKDIVAIIDDVVTSGSSLLKTRKLLGSNILVQGYYVVVKRTKIDLGIPLSYLLSPTDLK